MHLISKHGRYKPIIRAQGKIIADNDTILLDNKWYHYPLHRIREKIKTKIQTYTQNPWLLALMIGERHGLTKEDWQILLQHWYQPFTSNCRITYRYNIPFRLCNYIFHLDSK